MEQFRLTHRGLLLHSPGNLPGEPGFCGREDLDDVHPFVLRLVGAVAHLEGVDLPSTKPSHCHSQHLPVKSRGIHLVAVGMEGIVRQVGSANRQHRCSNGTDGHWRDYNIRGG